MGEDRLGESRAAGRMSIREVDKHRGRRSKRNSHQMGAQVAFLAVEGDASFHGSFAGPGSFEGAVEHFGSLAGASVGAAFVDDDFVPLVASLADRHGHDSRPLMGF